MKIYYYKVLSIIILVNICCAFIISPMQPAIAQPTSIESPIIQEEQQPDISAEALLEKLAFSNNDKIRTSIIWGGAGFGYLALSLLLPTQDSGMLSGIDKLIKLGYGISGILLLGGAWGEYRVDNIEIKMDLATINAIPTDSVKNLHKREMEAERSLKKRADEAYYQRISRSALLLSSCVWQTYFGGVGSLLGITLGGLGLYDIVTKTDIEKGSENYFNDKNDSTNEK